MSKLLRWNDYILGGCQIEEKWFENLDSLKVIFKATTSTLDNKPLKKDGKESVWQQWQKQKGEHKSTSLVWFWLCSANSKVAEFVPACTSLQGMAVKTITYTDNITAIYFICKFLFLIITTTKILYSSCNRVANLLFAIWTNTFDNKVCTGKFKSIG